MTPNLILPLATPAEALRLIGRARDRVKGQGPLLGLDFETTGLDPLKDRARLLSLSDGTDTVVIDLWQHDLAPLFPALRECALVCHNAAFDLSWLWRLGLTDLPRTVCTYLLSQLLDGTNQVQGHHSLAGCVKRYLGRELSKELQGSDWSGHLTPEQVAYAGEDARIVIHLMRKMGDVIHRDGLDRVADVELRCLPAWVWLRMSGVGFDRPAWEALAVQAQAETQALAAELDALAPPRNTADLFGDTGQWNWGSPKQCIEVLKGLGLPVRVQHHEDQWSRETSSDVLLAELDHPFAEKLRLHRATAQRLKMYGENWLDSATIHAGRLHAGFRQIGTDTGRTSCDKPNVQQTPRDGAYRRCFVAPPGRALVKCDYSTLQMRIACQQAQDINLWRIFQAHGDPHTETAKALTGKAEPTKADRQIAKSANFGLLFGMGAEGLRLYARTNWGVKLSPQEAAQHRTKWLEAYPGLARWHQQAQARQPEEVRSRLGRRRRLYKGGPVTEVLNSPVQMDEADILKTALALLWERRGECPGARPVLAVHDECVIECNTDQAEQAKAWLEEAMLDAGEPILEPVACAVDAKVVGTWGG